MKTLIAGAIRCSLMFLVTASLFSVRPAQAYTVTLEQVGSNVVATGSGAFNLRGLTLSNVIAINQRGFVRAFDATMLTGPSFTNGTVNFYSGLTGPTSFGSGSMFLADTGTGDFVGIALGEFLCVPLGYLFGAPLSDSMTFNNATFASLGVTPGTYVWSRGTGANQNFTLEIPAAVPESGSSFGLLLLSFAVLFGASRSRSLRLA